MVQLSWVGIQGSIFILRFCQLTIVIVYYNIFLKNFVPQIVSINMINLSIIHLYIMPIYVCIYYIGTVLYGLYYSLLARFCERVLSGNCIVLASTYIFSRSNQLYLHTEK